MAEWTTIECECRETPPHGGGDSCCGPASGGGPAGLLVAAGPPLPYCTNPLAADPGVFTELMERMGVQGLECAELWSVDAESLEAFK